LEKPLAMLLFGMLNWMFTGSSPTGVSITFAIAPIVRSLFLDGLHGLEIPGPKRKGGPDTISAATPPAPLVQEFGPGSAAPCLRRSS
jgi:hypothetical protein